MRSLAVDLNLSPRFLFLLVPTHSLETRHVGNIQTLILRILTIRGRSEVLAPVVQAIAVNVIAFYLWIALGQRPPFQSTGFLVCLPNILPNEKRVCQSQGEHQCDLQSPQSPKAQTRYLPTILLCSSSAPPEADIVRSSGFHAPIAVDCLHFPLLARKCERPWRVGLLIS